MTIRALIVDDEPLARERLRTLLVEEEDVEVVGESPDGRTAVRAIETLRPDVVFLDVQMPEMDGFAVLQALPPKSVPRVIFVTAYDKYALEAFDVHALDYLLKPFDRERFRRALGRARSALAAGAEKAPGLLELLERLLGETLPQAELGGALRAGDPGIESQKQLLDDFRLFRHLSGPQ